MMKTSTIIARERPRTPLNLVVPDTGGGEGDTALGVGLALGDLSLATGLAQGEGPLLTNKVLLVSLVLTRTSLKQLR